MTSPNHQAGGGGKTEIFNGAYHVPDFDDPEYHSGELVHVSDLIDTAIGLDYRPELGGRAFNAVYAHAVSIADGAPVSEIFARPIAARRIDWRYNRFNGASAVQKRLRLFFTNDLVADTFYDHMIPTATDWPARHLDVIEALLKARGYERESEKRALQLLVREAKS